MRLIHLTDPHLSSLEGMSFRSVRGKRKSGYLSWTQNRQHIHTRKILDHLVSAIRGEEADQIILTGDLIQIGTEQEVREVAPWLHELAPPDNILFVPGNHDVYTHDSWPALREHWNFLLPSKPESEPDSSTSPYPFIRDLGSIRLIGISSACVTPAFSARGSVGQRQFERLKSAITEAIDLEFMPALAIHHPPLPGMSIWRKALKEVYGFKSLFEKFQPALVWCGHLHRNIEVIEGNTHVFCTASASSTKNASYRIFDIEENRNRRLNGWDIRMQLKTIEADSGRFQLTEDKHWQVRL